MKVFRTCRIARFLVFLLFVVFMAKTGGRNIFAQTSMPSISMPEISSPSMPSVSMPSLSGSVNSSESSAQKKESNTSSSSTGTGLTATALLGLSNTTGLDTLSALLGVSDTSSSALSSTDASTISSLSSISSLLSSDSSLSALSGLSSTQSNSAYSNYLLLSQIIEKLNELSKKLDEANNGAAQPAPTQTSESAVAVSAQNTSSTKREIMRFRINGSNILSSITDIYISKPETDGSFLLTADRTYTADYKKRTETFYMFFTPATNNISSNLDVSVSVLQDYENQNSFLYRLADLSEQTAISAKKTGRLISIIINNPSFKVDFLLSLE